MQNILLGKLNAIICHCDPSEALQGLAFFYKMKYKFQPSLLASMFLVKSVSLVYLTLREGEMRSHILLNVKDDTIKFKIRFHCGL